MKTYVVIVYIYIYNMAAIDSIRNTEVQLALAAFDFEAKWEENHEK